LGLSHDVGCRHSRAIGATVSASRTVGDHNDHHALPPGVFRDRTMVNILTSGAKRRMPGSSH
jgi:hypothetical protein